MEKRVKKCKKEEKGGKKVNKKKKEEKRENIYMVQITNTHIHT